MEGMFLIHTSPLVQHRTIDEYAIHLVRRFVLKYYQTIVFDNPGRFPVTTKALEHRRHYGKLDEHNHHDFQPHLPTVKDWELLLKCQICKRNLTVQLSKSMLHSVPNLLPNGCCFITVGAQEAWHQDEAFMVTNASPYPTAVANLHTNQEEGDTRVSMHCKHSAGTNKLVFSPDTDTYHVGMSMLGDCHLSKCDIYVQLNKEGTKYIDISRLPSALSNDTDLAGLSHLPQCLQTLYVVTGCDYT